MPSNLPKLQSLLLDLVSTVREISPEVISKLDQNDWENLLHLANQHRLLPFLHWQLTKFRTNLPIPKPFLKELATSFKLGSMRALTLQHELSVICRILDRAEIPWMALKGAFLAYHCYPHPGMRRLRDFDILVPKELAFKAFDTLVAEGFSEPESDYMTVESRMDEHKHLNPLMSASGKVRVEIHVRLFKPSAGDAGLAGLADDPEFWNRKITRPLGRQVISYPSPTDLLLHIIVHAAYEHQFNNGPLTLSDIAYLLDSQPIDWNLFWRLARQGGFERACWLTFKLVERYWGAREIPLPDLGIDDSEAVATSLETAALLMSRAYGESDSRLVQLALDMQQRKSGVKRFGLLASRLFPPKQQVSATYSIPADSWRIFLCYPRHWWRLASDRVFKFLSTRSQVRDEIQVISQRAELEEWLQK